VGRCPLQPTADQKQCDRTSIEKSKSAKMFFSVMPSAAMAQTAQILKAPNLKTKIRPEAK
jgi:hypothetical protein